MTTLQSAIVALFQAVTSVLPLGEHAHTFLFTQVLAWPAADPHQVVAVQMAIVIAALFQMRHEFASATSGLLRMIFTFSKPKTVDEHLGLAMVGSLLPTILLRAFFPVTLEPLPAFVVGVIVFLTLVMVGSVRSGRKNKSLINWNFLDGTFVGLCSLCDALPGGGRPEGAFTGAFLRNYDLSSTIRFSFLALIPFQILKLQNSFAGIHDLGFPSGMSERLSLGVGFIIALFATALAMGALLVRNREVGFKRFGIYRIAVAIILAAWALRPRVL